jgi:hypothetical protein
MQIDMRREAHCESSEPGLVQISEIGSSLYLGEPPAQIFDSSTLRSGAAACAQAVYNFVLFIIGTKRLYV